MVCIDTLHAVHKNPVYLWKTVDILKKGNRLVIGELRLPTLVSFIGERISKA